MHLIVARGGVLSNAPLLWGHDDACLAGQYRYSGCDQHSLAEYDAVHVCNELFKGLIRHAMPHTVAWLMCARCTHPSSQLA